MLLEGIDSTPIRVAVIPKGLSMQTIGSALSDRIHDPTGGAAVFGGIVGGVDLEFLNASLAGGVADARAAALLAKEGLVVIGAIHGVVVQQPRNSAKANQAESAVRRGTWSAKRKERPSAAVHGQIFDRRLIDVGGKVGPVRDDDRSFGSCFNGFRYCLDAERGVNCSHAPDFHHDLGCPKACESFPGDLQGIVSRLEMDDEVPSHAVRSSSRSGASAKIPGTNVCAGHNGSRLVGYKTADGAVGGRLCECAASE